MFLLTVFDDLESYRSLRFLAKKKVFSSYRFWNRNSTFFILLFGKVVERGNLVFIFKVTQFSSIIWIGFQQGKLWQRHKILMFGKDLPCPQGNYIDWSVSQTPLVAFTIINIKWHALRIGNRKECETFHWLLIPDFSNCCWAFMCKLKNKTCTGITLAGRLWWCKFPRHLSVQNLETYLEMCDALNVAEKKLCTYSHSDLVLLNI